MPEIKNLNIIKKSQEYNQEDLEIENENTSNNDNNVEKEEYKGDLLYEWSFFEHENHKRGKFWFIGLGIFLLIMTIYCIQTNNILFLMIILMSFLFIFMFKFKKPELVDFKIFEIGIEFQNSFFEWDKIKEYYIIYDPERNVKKIYFIFKGLVETSLSVEIEKENPVIIRDILNNFIQENTVRKYEQMSDQISKIFKL